MHDVGLDSLWICASTSREKSIECRESSIRVSSVHNVGLKSREICASTCREKSIKCRESSQRIASKCDVTSERYRTHLYWLTAIKISHIKSCCWRQPGTILIQKLNLQICNRRKFIWKWCSSLVRASLFLFRDIIWTLYKYFTYIYREYKQTPLLKCQKLYISIKQNGFLGLTKLKHVTAYWGSCQPVLVKHVVNNPIIGDVKWHSKHTLNVYRLRKDTGILLYYHIAHKTCACVCNVCIILSKTWNTMI